MSKTIILLTKDNNYNRKFANWVNLNRNIGYLCSFFDDADKALEFASNNKVTHILISEEFQDDFEKFDNCCAFKFILSEEDCICSIDGSQIIKMKSWPETFEIVFKYRKMSDLLKEIDVIMPEEDDKKAGITVLFSAESIVSFQQAAAYVEKLLTENKNSQKCLFISFEAFPYYGNDQEMNNQLFNTSEIWSERKKGLSELIYDIKQRKKPLRRLLKEEIHIQKEYSFDLLRGINCFPDLYQFSAEDADWFIDEIISEGDYEKIFLFVKSLTEGTTELLIKCDRIDLFEDNATEAFFGQLKFAGLSDVIGKTSVHKL